MKRKNDRVTTTLDRMDVLNLIKGLRPPYGGNEYTKFTGNQWNEDWEWDMDKFKDMSIIGLLNLYERMKAYE